MNSKIKFEDISKKHKEFADKITRLGTNTIIKKEIPWEKVFWGRAIGTRQAIPFFHQKTADGKTRIFCITENGRKRSISKRDLPYMYDLWDKDGTLLSIAFLGL